MVDFRVPRAQRLPDLKAHSKRVPSLRRKRVRLGAVLNDYVEARGLWLAPIPRNPSYLQGIDGCAVRNIELTLRAQGTKSSFVRRQLVYHQCADTHQLQVLNHNV